MLRPIGAVSWAGLPEAIRSERSQSALSRIVRVEARRTVRALNLHELPDDNAEEPIDLWHSRILSTRVLTPVGSGHSIQLWFKANLQRL